jgi:hypothetical protein
MESVHLPRLKRAATVAPIQLTERDGQIIRRIPRHRFLCSFHILSLTGGSPQQIFRQLQLFYSPACIRLGKQRGCVFETRAWHWFSQTPLE